MAVWRIGDVFDAWIAEHEILADNDSDDYADITDRPLPMTEGEHNTGTIALPYPVRMTAVNTLSVTSLVLFSVAAFIHFA